MQQEPRLAAELDSEVTVAANGYSPPTPAPTHTSLILSKSNSTKKKNITNQGKISSTLFVRISLTMAYQSCKRFQEIPT